MLSPRGTEKSSLLEGSFPVDQVHYLNLLLPSVEDRFFQDPELLVAEVNALPASIKYIVIDEIQNAPKLNTLIVLIRTYCDAKKATLPEMAFPIFV